MKHNNQRIRKTLRYTFVLFMITVVLAPISAMAENTLPSIVLTGLNEYKSKGPEAAVKAWIKGSAFETSLEALSQANTFKQVETMYGTYLGYQVIKIPD